jgi:hypothetical protein
MVERGTLVRIKEVPGTRFASKRKPLWGIIETVARGAMDDELDRHCTVAMLVDLPFPEESFRSRSRVSLTRRNFDLPTDKQIPDWVCVELAKRALTKGSD